MGAGASVPQDQLDALSTTDKQLLVTKLEAKYVEKSGGDAAALDKYKKEFMTATNGAVSLGLKSWQAEVAKAIPDELTDAMASLKAGGDAADDDPSALPSATSFRQRRLTFSETPREVKAPSRRSMDDPEDLAAKVFFRAAEIGESADVANPFTSQVVGTYSCHGIEPAYNMDSGAVSKINQDRGCVVFPFGGQERQALFCCFDGHGEKGDVVSNMVMNEIQKRLEKHPKLADDPPKALKETFLDVDRFIGTKLGSDCKYSGTTAVAMLMRDNHVWVANAGDSRAVCATRVARAAAAGASPAKSKRASKDGAGVLEPGPSGLAAKDLSVDQNPDSPGEKERILAAGGFVSPPPEPGLSSRVWLDRKMTQVGLAMARSLGDHAVKAIGVIAEPEVTEFELGDADEWIVLASDGVWEFITSSEAVEIVAGAMMVEPAPPKGGTAAAAALAAAAPGAAAATKELSAAAACQTLIEQAALRWRHFEGDYRDDITAIVVRLNPFDLRKAAAASAALDAGAAAGAGGGAAATATGSAAARTSRSSRSSGEMKKPPGGGGK